MTLLVNIDECIEGKHGLAVQAEAEELKAKLVAKFPADTYLTGLYFESAILEEPEWPDACHATADIVLKLNGNPKIIRNVPVYAADDEKTGDEMFLIDGGDLFEVVLTFEHAEGDDLTFSE
jgi:hypothetical protein